MNIIALAISKRCHKCKEVKTFAEFQKKSSKKDGLAIYCHSCAKERRRQNQKDYYQANKEKCLQYSKAYYQANRGKVSQYQKDWREANMEKCSQYRKDYNRANQVKICQWSQEYKRTHKVKLLQSAKLRLKNRYKRDPLFKLMCNLRTNCTRARSKFGIKSKTAILLGCTWAEAQAHLIQTAILKYGSYSDAPNAYHVDHKLPLSKATNAEEMVKRCHISNLQYLTPGDNMAKGAKLDWEGDLCS